MEILFLKAFLEEDRGHELQHGDPTENHATYC